MSQASLLGKSCSMLFSSVLAIFLISWSSLFLLDYVLRVKGCIPYISFAEKYGLEVSPFQIRLYTTCNDNEETLLPKKKTPSLRRTLASIWFAIGALVSVVCIVAITGYLARLLYIETLKFGATRPHVAPYRAIPVTTTVVPVVTENIDDLPVQAVEDYDILDGSSRENEGLVPIVPGVNLPWSHMPLFMFVLIVSAIFHELGHAWAARNKDVKVNGFGVFVFALYPGAFTDIEADSLKRASTFSRLAIFGGGIWHNIILAIVAYLLFCATPYVLFPLFADGNGVTVTGVDMRSGLHGSAGLSPGFIVTHIDDCQVHDVKSWRECVRLLEHQRNGRCVETETLEHARSHDTSTTEDEIQCCDSFENITHAHMCFESSVQIVLHDKSTMSPSLKKVLRLGPNITIEEIVNERREFARQFSCMSARLMTDYPLCNSSVTCDQSEKSMTCAYPALYNGTQLSRITVKNSFRPVLYVGNLDELISFVSIHPLVSRFANVPHWVATTVEIIPKYFFTLSVALAALNAVPCYALDGQFLVVTIVNWLAGSLPRRKRQLLSSSILFIGTLLLVANILIGFLKFLF
ncbi:unnamed protein product [Auanema sp. JU1783]|nr:unnamed protein product [Auanema sp. JU1783]